MSGSHEKHLTISIYPLIALGSGWILHPVIAGFKPKVDFKKKKGIVTLLMTIPFCSQTA